MDKYHVYGIGNALVDMEYEIGNKFLREMKIEKGVMTLVDEERQVHLLLQLKEHGGSPRRACGGSAANTMIALAQLGGNGFYTYKVGDDDLGIFYQQNLIESGVNTTLTNGIYKGTTGKCLVLITPDADRTMNTFLGITQSFGAEQINEEELKKAEYIYIEGYLIANPTGRESMRVAKEMANRHGVKIALSLSDPFIVKVFRQELLEFLGEDGIDFAFCNERECMDLWQASDLDEAAGRMKDLAKYFVITLGGRGSLIYDGSDFLRVAPYPVTAVDTNGAGDMFAGAFLYGITHGLSFAEAGDLASAASSMVVANFGPRLSKEDTQSILQKFLNKRQKERRS